MNQFRCLDEEVAPSTPSGCDLEGWPATLKLDLGSFLFGEWASVGIHFCSRLISKSMSCIALAWFLILNHSLCRLTMAAKPTG